MDEPSFAAEVSDELASQLNRVLAGHPPEIQSAAIMQLFARMLAGIPPRLRETVIQVFVEHGKQLVPQIERELFGDAGHPVK